MKHVCVPLYDNVFCFLFQNVCLFFWSEGGLSVKFKLISSVYEDKSIML